MQEENRENTAGAKEEITGWYVPRFNAPQEVEGCYIHSEPLPVSLRSEPEMKKRPRKWLWIGIGIFAALAIAAAVILLMLRTYHPVTIPDDADSDASSIVNIFSSAATKIPRADTAEGIKLTISDPDRELTAQEVYEKVSPSTVIVLARQGERTSVGTGVIMTSDGYVITNTHVIAGGESAGIVLYGEYLLEAELVGYDREMDIAVLKALDASDLPVAEFGNSDLCRVGDTVYAIGNPLGVELYGTMSEGILSAINRDIKLNEQNVTALQTTAALNNGNSGGPLINTAGQVIGINTMKMGNVAGSTTAAQVEGLGFALPVSDVSYVVNDIIATGKYRGTPTFGIRVITSKDTGADDVVVVYSVEPDSSAAEAGMQEGDVILSLDGQEVHTVAELLAIRRSHAIGDVVRVKIWRSGETKVLTVKLRASK